MAKKKNHFVDNVALYDAFVEYHAREDVKAFLKRKAEFKERKAQGLEKNRFKELAPPLGDYIGNCIWLIAENYARKPNWRHLPYLDEMVADSIAFCLKYAYNFDPTKSKNPFAYITQGVYRAFLQYIALEKEEETGKRDLIRRAATGQDASFVGSAPMISTTHVQLLSKHYDDVEVLNAQTGTAKSKTGKDKANNGLADALDI